MTWISPAPGPITSPFGPRTLDGVTGLHSGIDIGVPVGTPVAASGDGVITFEGLNGVDGNTIIVSHPGGAQTVYGHLSKFAVPKGTRVSQGQKIGVSGGARGAPGAGNSRGPHIHFEFRQNNVPIDPQTKVTPNYTLPDRNPVTEGATPKGSPGAYVNLDPVLKYIPGYQTAKTLVWLSDPNKWKRLAMGVLGVSLLSLAAYKLLPSGTQSTIKTAVKTAAVA